MLNNHDEFTAATKRKLKALEDGKQYNERELNPILTEKVAAVIRQLDKDSSKNVNGMHPSRLLVKKQAESWINHRKVAGLGKLSTLH